MISSISVIIPSLGQIHLLDPLLNSIFNQTYHGSIEILLCTTGVDKKLSDTIMPLKTHISLKICDSPTPGISLARNVGLDQATGDLIVFLDEDCYLPSNDYLINIVKFCNAHPQSGGGGSYLTDTAKTNRASSFYNYMCNVWLESHIKDNHKTNILLGGCSFYPKSVIRKTRFPIHKPFAGEEADFNLEIVQKGFQLIHNHQWSVYHHPQYQIVDLFRRAWKHGQQIDRSHFMPPSERWRTFLNLSQQNPKEFFKFLPMTLAYSAWARLACAYNILKK